MTREWTGWLLLAVLSTTAGAVDVIGFLTLGLFTAHITGNLVVVAAHYVIRGASHIGPLLAVPVFLAVVSTVSVAYKAIDGPGHSPRRAAIAAEAMLLAACLGLGVRLGPVADPDSPMAVLVSMLAVAAMAAQAAVVKLSIPAAPATAVMTTNITALAIELATLAQGGYRADERARPGRRAGTLAVSVVGFVAGCVAGAVLELHFGLGAMALPVALAASTAALIGD
jgi:uncharacterized membrane protein YoaK (UPF0700 family)